MSDTFARRCSDAVVAGRRRRLGNKLIALTGFVVAFLTAYALVLPAVSLSDVAYCGHEEHSHSEACYTQAFVCDHVDCEVPGASDAEADGLDSTPSSEAGIESGSKPGSDATAGEPSGSDSSAAPIHVHSEGCYVVEQKLVCELPVEEQVAQVEADAASDAVGDEPAEAVHAHEQACYQEIRTLVCAIPEGADSSNADAASAQDAVAAPADEASGDANATSAPNQEAAHEHSEECYALELSCQLEEHVHNLACYSNPEADLEGPEDWEATLPAADALAGEWAEDLLAVAKSQLGYAESSENYAIADDGSVKGYTRYGDWYGDAYGDWCAMFVSFCLNYAGIPADAFPGEANCQSWIEVLSSEAFELYRPADALDAEPADPSAPEDALVPYEPKPGDLVFFDWQANGVSDHVGIVLEVAAASGDAPSKLRTIEGNASDVVMVCEYDLGDPSIMGYAELPEKPLAEADAATIELSASNSLTYGSSGEGVAGIYDGAKVYHSNGKFYQASRHQIGGGGVVTFALIPVEEGYKASSLSNYNYDPDTGWTVRSGANYVVAYCSDHETYSSSNGAEYSVFVLDNSRISSEASRQRLATIVAHSYPFISLADMKAEMKAVLSSSDYNKIKDCGESEFTAAIQQSIWMTTSPTSDLSDVGYSSSTDWDRLCVNPIKSAVHTSSSSYKEHVKLICDYLLGLEYLPDLEVTSWNPSYEQAGENRYNLTVEISLNRKVKAKENVTVQLVSGDKTSASTRLADGTQTFSLAIEGLTAEEVSVSQAKILVDGQRVQAYFYDSESYQDLIGGNWESFAYDLSFAVGAETTSVSVSKVWAGGAEATQAVSVQLYANGKAQGAPVSLNADNGWSYTWAELAKIDLMGNEIAYSVQEQALDGYVSKVEVSRASSNGKEWRKLEDGAAFTAGEKYLLVFPSGALGWAEGSSVGNSVLSWNRVSLANADSTPSNAVWTAEKSGDNVLLKNDGKGRYLALDNSKIALKSSGTKAVHSENKFALATTSSSNSGPGGRPSGSSSSSSTTYYLQRLDTNGYGVTTTDASKALPVEVYQLVEAVESASEINFLITNYQIDSSARPTTISVEKVWAGGRGATHPASATVYLLQDGLRYGDAVTLSADNVWSHTWTGLPTRYVGQTGSISYSIEEVPVDGYTTSVAQKQGNANGYVITNTRDTVFGSIAIKKVSSSNAEKLLAGAEFDLYVVDTLQGEPIPGLGINQPVVKFNEASLVTDQQGSVVLSDIEVGEAYYLVETQSPAGYNRLPCPVHFTVTGASENPVVTVVEGSEGQSWAHVSPDEQGVLVVSNADGYTLPHTGGTGTTPFTIGGMLLLALGAFLLLCRAQRRGRSVA